MKMYVVLSRNDTLLRDNRDLTDLVLSKFACICTTAPFYTQPHDSGQVLWFPDDKE